jgi:hypothetical protein
VYTLLLVGGAGGNPPIKLLPVVSDEDKTRVQFVNQSNTPVDVYLKGQTQPLAPALKSGASTDFTAVPSSAVTFVVRNAGSHVTDRELAVLETQLRPERDLVVTVSNAGGALQITVTSESLTAATPSATAQGTTAATQAIATAVGTTTQ